MLDSGVFILQFDDKKTVSHPCVNSICGPTKHFQSLKQHAKSDFSSSSVKYCIFIYVNLYLENTSDTYT